MGDGRMPSRKIQNISAARKEVKRLDRACKQILRGFRLYARHPNGPKMKSYGMRLGTEGGRRAAESLSTLREWLK
jgi:hypothetical protein